MDDDAWEKTGAAASGPAAPFSGEEGVDPRHPLTEEKELKHFMIIAC